MRRFGSARSRCARSHCSFRALLQALPRLEWLQSLTLDTNDQPARSSRLRYVIDALGPMLPPLLLHLRFRLPHLSDLEARRLPRTLRRLELLDVSPSEFDLKDLPSGLQHLEIVGSAGRGRVSGFHMGELPRGLLLLRLLHWEFECYDLHAANSWPSTLVEVIVHPRTSVSSVRELAWGADLPQRLRRLEAAFCGLSGVFDLKSLPPSLASIDVRGNPLVPIDVTACPPTVRLLRCDLACVSHPLKPHSAGFSVAVPRLVAVPIHAGLSLHFWGNSFELVGPAKAPASTFPPCPGLHYY